MPQKSRDLLNAPPQKVILMYQSVIDLINEGADINVIKVADITKRAGIGKGTAYEYFSTKEEIITRALLYNMMKHTETLNQTIMGMTCFEEMIKFLLDYIELHFHEGRTLFQALKIALGAYDISDLLRQEFEQTKQENVCRQFSVLQDAILECGVKENQIKETNGYRQKMALNSQLSAYAIFLTQKYCKGEDNMTVEEAKQFTYEGILKLLG